MTAEDQEPAPSPPAVHGQTKSGQPITDEQIAALAAESEAGYDVQALVSGREDSTSDRSRPRQRDFDKATSAVHALAGRDVVVQFLVGGVVYAGADGVLEDLRPASPGLAGFTVGGLTLHLRQAAFTGYVIASSEVRLVFDETIELVIEDLSDAIEPL